MDFDIEGHRAALRNAHAAGDTRAAERFAEMIANHEASQGGGMTPSEQKAASSLLGSQRPPEEKPLEGGFQGLFGLPGTSGGEKPQGAGLKSLKEWFTGGPGKDISLAEAGGTVAGSAVGGAAAGAALPKVLTTAGKFLPGGIGTAAKGLGEALSVVPARDRMARGFGAGVATGTVDAAKEKFGLPAYLTLPADIAASMAGESAGNFVGREIGQVLGFAFQTAKGNMGKAGKELSGLLKPNEKANAAVAANLQDKVFGSKTDAYLDKLTSSENRLNAQRELFKADPQLSTYATTASQGSYTASDLYRDKMFSEVGNAIRNGKRFSDTPEFAGFVEKLNRQVRAGEVPKSEAERLVRSLGFDRSKVAGDADIYGKTVDNRIREWGKSQEVGGQTGAAAIRPAVSKELREELRTAYNGYLSNIGLGNMERQYRKAYQTEMLAEAKDKLPQFVAGFGKEAEFSKIVRNLKQDLEGADFVKQSLARHLANTPPDKVVSEFTRLQKQFVNADLLTLKQMSQLRDEANRVQTTLSKGEDLGRGNRLRQMAIMLMVQKAAGEAGGALTRQE